MRGVVPPASVVVSLPKDLVNRLDGARSGVALPQTTPERSFAYGIAKKSAVH
jgi:hypothetical protein